MPLLLSLKLLHMLLLGMLLGSYDSRSGCSCAPEPAAAAHAVLMQFAVLLQHPAYMHRLAIMHCVAYTCPAQC